MSLPDAYKYMQEGVSRVRASVNAENAGSSGSGAFHRDVRPARIAHLCGLLMSLSRIHHWSEAVFEQQAVG